MPIDAVYMNSC